MRDGWSQRDERGENEREVEREVERERRESGRR